jgi:CRP-like cAMP-binding protein
MCVSDFFRFLLQKGVVPTTCHICPFRQSCLVAGVEKEGLDKFSFALLRYAVKERGRSVFNQGERNEAFVFLCNGLVKTVKNLPDGRDVILEMLSAFSLVNVPPESSISRHPFSAVTVSDVTELASIKKGDLFNLLNSYPKLGDNLCGHVSRRFVTSFNMLGAIQMEVHDRILTILAFFRDAWKAEEMPGYVKIPLTQGELAQLVQTTPETISRMLRRLRDEKIVQVSPTGDLLIASAALKDYLNEERGGK